MYVFYFYLSFVYLLHWCARIFTRSRQISVCDFSLQTPYMDANAMQLNDMARTVQTNVNGESTSSGVP